MAIEKLTEAQLNTSKAALAECQSSLSQQILQAEAEQVKQLAQTVDQATKLLADMPELAIGKLNEAIQFLMSIINGYKNPSDPGFDIMSIISQIEALLKPVITALQALPIPEIPGLSTIIKLLNALKTLALQTISGAMSIAAEGVGTVANGLTALNAPTSMLKGSVGGVASGLSSLASAISVDVPINNESGQSNKSSESSESSASWQQQLCSNISSGIKTGITSAYNALVNMVELPIEMITMLNDLLCALMALCTTLPLVLINLIFQMLNTIIGLFKQIAGILGVPSIPFPLSLIPNCISMMPDIYNFVINAPGKIMNVTYGALKSAYGVITQASVPNPKDAITKPSILAPCPKRDVNANSDLISSRWSTVGSAFDNILSSSSSFMSNATSSTVSLFTTGGQTAWNTVAETTSSTGTALKDIGSNMIDAGSNVWNSVANIFN